MKETMQDSQKTKDELWKRLWKEFGQLVYLEGMNEHVKRGANGDLVDFIASEISKAREEGRKEVIHKLKKEIDMAEVSKFIDAHQDFFNSFGESVLLKISELNNNK